MVLPSYYASSCSLKSCFLKVGQILDTLDRLNLSEKTLVYFTSDHGAHIDLGRKGGSNVPFKGGKGMGAIEGGIRVPAMIRWPGKNIEGNLNEINTATTLMDFFPTIKDILENESGKNEDAINLQHQIDGKSFYPLLKGQVENIHTFIRHYCGTAIHALRLSIDENIYKAWFKRPLLNINGHCGEGQLCSCFGGPDILQDMGCNIEIFDLQNDPTEKAPIKRHSQLYKDLKLKFLKEYVRINSDASRDMHECEIENTMNSSPGMNDNLDVPSQFASFFETMPRPWMQPCARFPYCKI